MMKRLDRKQVRRLVGSTLNEIWTEQSPSMDSADLMEFADAWCGLGDAVQRQVRAVLDNPREADVNPNAITLAMERLGGMNEEIDQGLQEWLDEHAEGGY